MIARRNLALYVILSLVTFGIWGLVWFFQIGGDIARLRGDGKPSALIDLLLAIVTCGIWGIILGYTWGDKLNEGLRNSGRPTNENLPILTLILGIFGLQLVSFALWQVELNKAAAK